MYRGLPIAGFTPRCLLKLNDALYSDIYAPNLRVPKWRLCITALWRERHFLKRDVWELALCSPFNQGAAISVGHRKDRRAFLDKELVLWNVNH